MRRTMMVVALAAAFGSPFSAAATDDREIAQIRDEIRQMKEAYEARIQALEKRLQDAEARSASKAEVPAASAPSETAPANSQAAASGSTAFNPAVSLILGGSYTHLSQDPSTYRIRGFMPGGEIGPGRRSFNLGESELTLSANVDPYFSGKLTFSLTPENEVSVEEAYAEANALPHGVGFRAGRFLSSVGYLNSQHAHAWDFADAPLAYQAFLGGQYKQDGIQLRWLLPTDRYLEVGLEAGNGNAFPGSEHNRNGFGSTAVFAHLGDDIGDSASWRAGLSYLRTTPAERRYDDTDLAGMNVMNAFGGRSGLWIADGIFKWAPNGNATHTSFKLQGEYFRRRENGSLTYDIDSQSAGIAQGPYASAQSGGYLQGVYQFMPGWRVGLRHDWLRSGSPHIGLAGNGAFARADFPQLLPYRPSRNALMVDWSPSEFSRLRLQFARDRARSDVADTQIFIQYIMSLGAHGAHAF